MEPSNAPQASKPVPGTGHGVDGHVSIRRFVCVECTAARVDDGAHLHVVAVPSNAIQQPIKNDVACLARGQALGSGKQEWASWELGRLEVVTGVTATTLSVA